MGGGREEEVERRGRGEGVQRETEGGERWEEHGCIVRRRRRSTEREREDRPKEGGGGR